MKLAQRAGLITVTATVLVVVSKLTAGFITNSVSVLSEGIQSLVDIFIAIGVLVSIRVAAQPPDEDHPYGHGKAEVLMSAFEMLLLLATSGFIISQAIQRFVHPEAVSPNLGLIVMGSVGVLNFLLSMWLTKVSKSEKSLALDGEAMHLRADALAACGVFIGLLLVKLTGKLWIDPLTAICFALIVMGSSLNKLRQLIHPLMDGALPKTELEGIERALASHPQVKGFHNVFGRTVGSERHVELHVLLEDSLSFVDAHALAEEIEDEIRAALGGAEVLVHYEPYEYEMQHQKDHH